MPNNCNGWICFSDLTEKNALKLRNCIQSGKFCETVFPQPKEVLADSRLEQRYWDAEEKYFKRTGQHMSVAETKELQEKYPFKQLWYNWNVQNWGTKWGMCDASILSLRHYDTKKYELSVTFWTARSPLSKEVLEKCSSKFGCNIVYTYDEPGMCFSGEQRYANGELVLDNYREDAYYGETRVCLGCNGSFGDLVEDDWFDGNHYICATCGEKLVREYTQHTNKLKRIMESIDYSLNEDTYRIKIINKIMKRFNIEQFEIAEFIYDAYEDGLLFPNNSQNEN